MSAAFLSLSGRVGGLSFLLIVLLSAPTWGQNPLPAVNAGASAEVSEIEKDIVYSLAGGQTLTLDVLRPMASKRAQPAVVYFHGGGWQAGAKWHGHEWIKRFARQGYVGVTVGYRFAPQFKWPSQVEDAKAAIRFLRAHAAAYQIDPDRIAVVGESAGGYLALMLGVTSTQDGFDQTGENRDVSSRVRAVASYSSATDFTSLRRPGAPRDPQVDADMLRYYGKTGEQVVKDFTGAEGPDDPILKRISVLTYVSAGDAPTLIVQGDADPIVEVAHASALAEAFKKAGVPHRLYLVPGGGHGWKGAQRQETDQVLDVFLAEQFR